jgi:hypothetical protein
MTMGFGLGDAATDMQQVSTAAFSIRVAAMCVGMFGRGGKGWDVGKRKRTMEGKGRGEKYPKYDSDRPLEIPP